MRDMFSSGSKGENTAFQKVCARENPSNLFEQLPGLRWEVYEAIQRKESHEMYDMAVKIQ
jgi:hypothetical protein